LQLTEHNINCFVIRGRKQKEVPAEGDAEAEVTAEVEAEDDSNVIKLQTLVFTATLSNSLRFDVKKRKAGKKSKGKASEGSMGN
jgi:hypothetical protein